MYKLSIEFKSKEELIAFLSESKSHSANIDTPAPMAERPAVIQQAPVYQAPQAQVMTERPLTPQEKAKATREANLAKKAREEAEAAKFSHSSEPMTEVPSPFSQLAPQAPAFDRQAAIAQASGLVQALRAKGLQDSQIQNEMHVVFDMIGAPKHLRVSELDDYMIAEFLPQFAHRVSMVGGQAQAAPTGSFI